MAQAKTIRFGNCMILLGDGAEPEVFTAPCGFSELTMTVNIETNTVNIPDCDDPDLPAWIATDVVSHQMTVQGSGVIDTDAMQMWQDWWFGSEAGAEKNVRWFRDLTGANGGGYFQGPATLTAYEETGSRGQRWQMSAAIAFNGKPTFNAAT